MRIDIVVFEGFDELDAIGPFEVFQNAAKLGADFEVRLVSPSGAGEVRAGHGLRILADAGLDDGPRPDVIVVPGGGWGDRRPNGAWGEAARGKIPSHLAELHAAGTTVAAVCTGAMLVAAAGLLTGRPANTHYVGIEDLRAAGATIIRERVVDDVEIVTAGGVTAGLDLALSMVERLAGAEIAQQVAKEMEYERVGSVWRRR